MCEHTVLFVLILIMTNSKARAIVSTAAKSHDINYAAKFQSLSKVLVRVAPPEKVIKTKLICMLMMPLLSYSYFLPKVHLQPFPVCNPFKFISAIAQAKSKLAQPAVSYSSVHLQKMQVRQLTDLKSHLLSLMEFRFVR